jgi:hypothetical protein
VEDDDSRVPITDQTKFRIFSQNCDGFKTKIIDPIFESDYEFIFLQETHHLPSTKNIHNVNGKYLVFHQSGVDETQENPKRRGGLITYINVKISSSTKPTVLSNSKHYLVVVIGSLVTVNVYLPQQGLYERDLPIPTYRLILDEILAFIESLGPKYAYHLTGDFNNNGPNAPHFRAFCDILQPENWSSHIKYTYSAKGRGGINTSKIDHVLTKNFSTGSLVSCETIDTFITRSPHSPIETITKIQHLSIRDVDLTLEGNLIPKTKIDFQATTQDQKDWILDQATKIVKKEYPQGAKTKTNNPSPNFYHNRNSSLMPFSSTNPCKIQNIQ